MKIKTLAAVAYTVTILVASSAQAQSSVTLYGLVDAGIEYSRAGTSLTRLISGGSAGSRLGFRGVEDLGGGLSAVFRLESGFNVDNGTLAQGGRMFGREASIGLSSKALGTLLAGRLGTPYYANLSGVDAFGFSESGGMLAATKTGGGGPQILPLGVDARSDNSLSYISPVWSGFEGRLFYTLGDEQALPIIATSKGRGASFRYRSGAVDALVAYTLLNAPRGGTGEVKGVVVGGSYDFQWAKLFAGFTNERNSCSNCVGALARTGGVTGVNESDFRVTNFGIRVPVGKLTVMGQVLQVKDQSGYTVNPGNRDSTRYAIGAEYQLSKRTMAYTSFATMANRNGSAYAIGTGPVQQSAGRTGPGNPRASVINVGVRHVF